MISKQIIQGKAFRIFRDWAANALMENPGLNLNIKDETALVETLMDSIQRAKAALLNKEKLEKRKMAGYDVGFMLGFIPSNLNSTWQYEYIIKQSNEYKEFIAIKAIKQYFELDDLSKIRISNLYKQLLLKDMNIENADTSIPLSKNQ